MKNLVTELRKESELHPLVLGSVFHYELEFIHPLLAAKETRLQPLKVGAVSYVSFLLY